MKHVNRFPELCYVHRAIRSTLIVRAHLPDRLGKATQDLCTFVPLPDLSLI
jgi:hypothetical protein